LGLLLNRNRQDNGVWAPAVVLRNRLSQDA
jgi:hypothetical protein